MIALLGWLLPLLLAPSLVPAGPEAMDPSQVRAQLSRLEGHGFTVNPDGRGFTIDDIAGEGRPRVGVVERRGQELWLIEDGGTEHRLEGRLAIPRIAGPGYRVWVLGEARGSTIVPRRLGVLAPPAAR